MYVTADGQRLTVFNDEERSAMRGVIYQCKTCGARVRARERRAHLGDVHHDGASAFDAKQVAAGFTRTIDPHDPSRADKWGYTDGAPRSA